MSPTPGTLQIPASSRPGVVSAVSWFGATRAACPDGAAAVDAAAVPDVDAAAACAAGAVFAIGAAFTAGAALAERAMNSPLNTIAKIALISSTARADRRRLFVLPARGRDSAISGGSCIRRFLLG